MVRAIHGWRRRLGWLGVCLTVVLLGAGAGAAAEPTKFTVMTVVLKSLLNARNLSCLAFDRRYIILKRCNPLPRVPT